MKLDRAYQLDLLKMLADSYPMEMDTRDVFYGMIEEERGKYFANMVYLEEHGLIDSGIETRMGSEVILSPPRITAKGMDFLADDGGLSAILGVVTVKFHEETLRALIEGRITSSDLPLPEKQKLLDGLRELPAESIKHLTMKLLDLGLENLPAALPIVQTFLMNL